MHRLAAPPMLFAALLLAVQVHAQAAEKVAASFIQPDEEADVTEPLNEGRTVSLTPEMIEKFASELGIEPHSPRMRQILDSYYNPESDLNLAINSDVELDQDTPQKVIRHIRGTDGIPLPTKDEVLLPFKLTPEAVKESLDKYFYMTETTAKQNMTVPELPNCKENITERTATNYSLAEDTHQVLLDILFMKKEDIPVDYKEIFGKRVVVRPYNKEKSSVSVLGIGVKCLPTRFRVTRSFVMHDLGKNALKNYDIDPHGEGEFHEYMKAKLKIQ